MAEGKLTALQVQRALRPGIKPGMLSDGRGLYLQIGEGGARSWICRYQLNGRTRDYGLGSARDISLRMARELVAELRRLRATGVDPLDKRRSERAVQRVEAAKAMTFDQCAEVYVEAHEQSWSQKHHYDWCRTLRLASQIVGKLPVREIDTSLILKCVEPIWTTKNETASRLRNRIEHILDWAKVRGYRDGENPARWRGHLDHILPRPSKIQKIQHLAAVPYVEMPAFMADLRTRQDIRARCLEFTILTAVRTREATGARWSEIDLRAGVWVIPAERMKGGREHRVPLSPRAAEILHGLHAKREGAHVFTGDRAHAPLSHTAMLKVMALMGRSETVHGFRSSFRDWCAETTNYPNHVVEMALAHTIGDKVEAAYRRGDLFEHRRRLADSWAAFCGKAAATGKVVPIRVSAGV